MADSQGAGAEVAILSLHGVHVTDNNVEDCSHFQGRDEARCEGNKEHQATESNVEVHGPWRKLSPQIAISKLDDFPLYHWHIHRCRDI